jgi:Na+/melibiose symporter-like transporter
LTAGVIFNLFWTGVAAFVGKRFTNYQIYLVSVIVSGLGMLAVPNLLDMSILAVFIVFFGFFGFSVFSLWVYGYVFAYEIGDLSELVNDKRHDGILVSYLSFVLKMGGAVGMWIIGVVLEFYGYVPNAAEQSEVTIKGMTYLISIFPFVLHVVAFVFLLKYQLVSDRYAEVFKLLEKKRAGQDVSTESITALY